MYQNHQDQPVFVCDAVCRRFSTTLHRLGRLGSIIDL